MYLICRMSMVLQALMPDSYLLPTSHLFHRLLPSTFNTTNSWYVHSHLLNLCLHWRQTFRCRRDSATCLEKEISRHQRVEVNNILQWKQMGTQSWFIHDSIIRVFQSILRGLQIIYYFKMEEKEESPYWSRGESLLHVFSGYCGQRTVYVLLLKS